jgi:hypothetical protein
MDSWLKIKGFIKDVKKRRGRKGMKVFIRFAGFGNNNKKIAIDTVGRRRNMVLV